MKICPNCKAQNSDRAISCVECDKYLIGVDAIDDDITVKSVFEKSERKAFKKSLIIIIVVIGFFILYNIWAVWMFNKVFGSLTLYYPVLIMYIPCILMFLYPYDWTYRKVRSVLKLSDKGIPDWLAMIFRAAAVIFLLMLYARTYEILAFTRV